MAVVSCTLKRTGKTGRFYVDSKGGIAGDINVEWQVITNSTTDGPVTVYNEALTATPDKLPPLFATYAIGGEVDPGLFLMSVSTNQNESKLTQWSVTGSYKNLPFGVTSTDANTNPLLRPWKYRIDFDTISKVITEGWNVESFQPLGLASRPAGTRGPITNTAGQEFGDTVEEPRTRLIYVGTRNFSTLAEITAIGIQYADSLNSSPFQGYPIGYCEFLGIQASDLINESGVEYYQGTVRIALNQKPVQLNAVNSGWKAWLSGTNISNVRDEKGQSVSEPILLTADGQDPRIATGANTQPQASVSYWTRENQKNFSLIFNSPAPP